MTSASQPYSALMPSANRDTVPATSLFEDKEEPPPLAGSASHAATTLLPSRQISGVQNVLNAEQDQHEQKQHVLLSNFFPKDTIYFYSFPTGEYSGFFNAVPPWVEELVAARPMSCAGDDMRVLTFAATAHPEVRTVLTQFCKNTLLPENRVMTLPSHITHLVKGMRRNQEIERALLERIEPKQLIMAQPFLTPALQKKFQISPELTVWLNDKLNIEKYVSSDHRPGILMKFDSGAALAGVSPDTLPLPSVIKVTSSSTGDGVRVCRTVQDIRNAQANFAALHTPVIVEEYIEAVRNYCIQFGIPADAARPIQIIGHNEQFVSECGEFLGGMVMPHRDNENTPHAVYEYLATHVLPKVRSLGWYGVGGLDVLVTAEGKFYVIDSNFRMTATFAFVCRSYNVAMPKAVLGFVGMFQGDEKRFRENILPLAIHGTPEQRMDIIALGHSHDLYRINAGLLFGTGDELVQNARLLLDRGIKSSALEKIVQTGKACS